MYYFLAWLHSLRVSNTVEIHPRVWCVSTVSFYGRVVFHGMNVSHFIYLTQLFPHESYFLQLTVSHWSAVTACMQCLSLPQPQRYGLPMVGAVTTRELQE